MRVIFQDVEFMGALAVLRHGLDADHVLHERPGN